VVNTYGTAINGVSDEVLSDFIMENFPLTPNWITTQFWTRLDPFLKDYLFLLLPDCWPKVKRDQGGSKRLGLPLGEGRVRIRI